MAMMTYKTSKLWIQILLGQSVLWQSGNDPVANPNLERLLNDIIQFAESSRKSRWAVGR